ncbi:lipopolysaccharide biosynthesis protein [Paenibacillus humicola]|uniref:lipopolysaccharide biosynthesis protein n=1 Tax=Paenibacillus humicola TaxID=3110540 RepID=UPI00237B92FD|nr:hypothetical protein [Paenibacillus humicola]
MRVKKASINVLVNLLTFIIGSFPAFFVRKAMLTALGNEILGLSSLYTSIIGLLSIVDLGIGSAIIFSLYKPFAEGRREKVMGYMRYYRNFYFAVGGIILMAGLVLLPFLRLFIRQEVDIADAQMYFLLFLANTLLSYLFSYKLCLIQVAQDGYIVSIATVISKLAIAVLQYLILVHYPNFCLYLWIQIAVNAVYFMVLNLYVKRRFSWMNSTEGSLETEEKRSLSRNIRALFLHKLGGILVLGTDNLVISSYLSLTVVGIYNSYMLVIGSLQGMISYALQGVTASVGNLLATGDEAGAYDAHRRLFFLNFWIVSFATISLYNTLSPFIYLWLGDQQILDPLTINVLLINFYFFLMRGSVERFKEGGGIYHQDRFAPVFEAGINLLASVILVQKIGLAGVFIGTLISNIGVVFWVKPKMVYKYVFKVRLGLYFKMYIKYLAIGVIPLAATYLATNSLKHDHSFSAFVANCLINIVLINAIYLLLFWNNKEFAYFKALLLSLLKKALPAERGGI